MSQSLHPMLNIAIKAARAAGAIINRGSQDLDLLTVTHKGPNDFVSEVDQAAENAIIDILLTAYPGHGILAEESGREHGARDSEFTWIIDPLDGTTNFLHGFPVYAVSIALAHRGIVQQAVVYDPTRNDLFFASRGRGAFLNDKRLRVSKRTRLADSLIGTGFPFRRGDSFQRYVAMFETVMQACAGVRRPGAAALDLCYVAAGWYDGFFEIGLNAWDMAAGSLMITEAGGLVGNFTGEADFLHQREIVAGCPKVYGQLVSLLAPHTRVVKATEAGAATPETEHGGAADGDVVNAALAAAAGVATSAGAVARERKPLHARRPLAGADAASDAAASEHPAPFAPHTSKPPKPARPAPTVSYKAPEARSPDRERDFRADPRNERRGDRPDTRPAGPARSPAKPSSRGPTSGAPGKRRP